MGNCSTNQYSCSFESLFPANKPKDGYEVYLHFDKNIYNEPDIFINNLHKSLKNNEKLPISILDMLSYRSLLKQCSWPIQVYLERRTTQFNGYYIYVNVFLTILLHLYETSINTDKEFDQLQELLMFTKKYVFWYRVDHDIRTIVSSAIKKSLYERTSSKLFENIDFVKSHLDNTDKYMSLKNLYTNRWLSEKERISLTAALNKLHVEDKIVVADVLVKTHNDRGDYDNIYFGPKYFGPNCSSYFKSF